MTSRQSTERPPRPGGAMVAVVSRSPDGPRFLLLHNAECAPGEEGDWAWGPPSGCLEPDEDVATCAARELFEETGIRAAPRPVATEGVRWAMFFLEVPWRTEVRLDPNEHDDFVWATFDEACRLCRPERVTEDFQFAVRSYEMDRDGHG